MTYTIRLANFSDCNDIVMLLNSYLSFGLSDTEGVKASLDNSCTVNLICANGSQLVGYLRASIFSGCDTGLEHFLLRYGYSPSAIKFVLTHYGYKGIISIDQGVLHPSHRGKHVSTMLLGELTDLYAKSTLIGILWVSAKNGLVQYADRQDVLSLRIPRYWESDNLSCPSCGTPCVCDALIVCKQSG